MKVDWKLILVLLLAPLAVLWPLPAVFDQQLLTHPRGEAAAHLWALWAALGQRSALLYHSSAVSWPDGVDVLLIDPLNLPWVALGAPWGPAAAYNAILLGGTVLMGVAGALLAPRVGGAAWLGAAAAIASPAFVSGTIRGATEQLSVAWVGIALALLLLALERGRLWIIAAGLAMGACAWGGPYNGLWVALVGLVVGGAAVARRRWTEVGRALGVAGVAALAAAPVARAIVRSFSVMQDSRFDTPSELAMHDRLPFARGGNIAYADLLDPWVPAPITGDFSELSQTTYLGVAVLSATALALRARRDLWPWAVGAAAMVALAFGPALYLDGALLKLGGRPVPGPTALLAAAPGLGHLTHWYRVAPVASLLLAAVVSTLGERRWAPLLVPLMVADLAAFSPFTWPLAGQPAPGAGIMEGLEPGVIVEVPDTTQPDPPEGAWRNAGPLAQIEHGMPITATVMLLPVATSTTVQQGMLKRLVRRGSLSANERETLLKDGFRWVLVRTPYEQALARVSLPNLERCLGAPAAKATDAVVFDLRAGPPGDCVSTLKRAD